MALVHGSHNEIYMWGLQDYELTIALDLMYYAFDCFIKNSSHNLYKGNETRRGK